MSTVEYLSEAALKSTLLLILGFEVDFINSVQFCTDTWYDVCQGQVLHSSELKDLYEGLRANNLQHYSYLLTGYIGDQSFLQRVYEIIMDMKTKNPKLKYVCDPVLGDAGIFYVPEDLLEVYRDLIIPIADILVPNQFEAEQLTGTKINSQEDAVKAMNMLHDKGPSVVVLSSTELEKDTLIMLASIHKDSKQVCIRTTFPKLDVQFVGSGDLFAALLLAWSHSHPDDLKLVCEKVQSTMQCILNRTLEHGRKLAGPGNVPKRPQLELRLIQSQKEITNPQITVTAEYINV